MPALDPDCLTCDHLACDAKLADVISGEKTWDQRKLGSCSLYYGVQLPLAQNGMFVCKRWQMTLMRPKNSKHDSAPHVSSDSFDEETFRLPFFTRILFRADTLYFSRNAYYSPWKMFKRLDR
jgi:hypothetical protein